MLTLIIIIALATFALVALGKFIHILWQVAEESEDTSYLLEDDE